jgi:hypothetical protein
MFCSNCGKQIEGTPVFCPYCGTKTDSAQPVHNEAQPAFQSTVPPQPVHETPQAGKFKALRVLSIIGFVWFPFFIFVPSLGMETVEENYQVMGLFICAYTLVYAIAALVQGVKHKIGFLKAMSVIALIWCGWAFIEIVDSINGGYWGTEHGVPMLGTAVFALVFSVFTFVKVNNTQTQFIEKNTARSVLIAVAVTVVVLIIFSNSAGTQQNYGRLPNTSWESSGSVLLGNYSQTINFGRGRYNYTCEYNFLGVPVSSTTETGAYTVSGETVIFTSDEEKTSIGMVNGSSDAGKQIKGSLIGNSLTVGGSTYK